MSVAAVLVDRSVNFPSGFLVKLCFCDNTLKGKLCIPCDSSLISKSQLDVFEEIKKHLYCKYNTINCYSLNYSFINIWRNNHSCIFDQAGKELLRFSVKYLLAGMLPSLFLVSSSSCKHYS